MRMLTSVSSNAWALSVWMARAVAAHAGSVYAFAHRLYTGLFDAVERHMVAQASFYGGCAAGLAAAALLWLASSNQHCATGKSAESQL